MIVSFNNGIYNFYGATTTFSTARMDAQRRELIAQVFVCFAQVIVLKLPGFVSFRANGLISKLKIILYTLALLIRPPLPPVPKYEQIIFENNVPRRQQRGNDVWEALMDDEARCWALTGETPQT